MSASAPLAAGATLQGYARAQGAARSACSFQPPRRCLAIPRSEDVGVHATCAPAHNLRSRRPHDALGIRIFSDKPPTFGDAPNSFARLPIRERGLIAVCAFAARVLAASAPLHKLLAARSGSAVLAAPIFLLPARLRTRLPVVDRDAALLAQPGGSSAPPKNAFVAGHRDSDL